MSIQIKIACTSRSYWRFIRKNRCYKNNTFRIMERSKMDPCKFCDSGNIIGKGFKKNRSGKLQIFKCKD